MTRFITRYVERDAKSWLTLHNARENNLKKITVDFPLGCMTTVTGVSGSGKSTLVNEILFKALSNHFYSSKEKPGTHDKDHRSSKFGQGNRN